MIRKLPLWLACATLIFAEPLAAQHTLNVRDADIRAVRFENRRVRNWVTLEQLVGRTEIESREQICTSRDAERAIRETAFAGVCTHKIVRER